MSFSTNTSNQYPMNLQFPELTEQARREQMRFLRNNSYDATFNGNNLFLNNFPVQSLTNNQISNTNSQSEYRQQDIYSEVSNSVEEISDSNNNEFLSRSSQSSSQSSIQSKSSESGSSSISQEFCQLRVQSAPARPLTDIEEFKKSEIFMILEQTIVRSSKLIQTDLQKFDLDSSEGQKSFKKYLQLIERLIKALKVEVNPREYRENFTKAYKILYKEGELSYLNEILDSAQEAFPYLYVNGEKYVFTEKVLQLGKELMDAFFKMQNSTRLFYQKICQESSLDIQLSSLKDDLKKSLTKFDFAWAQFEEVYVTELMAIEKEARRFVQNAIDILKELEKVEIREKTKGKFFIQNNEYLNLQENLCKQICLMNSVANMEGKGRDDLDFNILQQAEGILRRITNEQSRAVRCLAEQIKDNFSNLRTIIKKYEDNIEMVDPQLKNNTELVSALNKYEDSWEKGKNYFLDGKKCSFLIHFSHIIETTGQKYKSFQELIECRDADIFLFIPCLLVLKLLDREDKGICNFFLPQIFEKGHKYNAIYEELNQEFLQWKSANKRNYAYYNILEQRLLNITNGDGHNIPQTDKIIQKIKILAMDIQRHNPVEWNSFLDVSLCN